MVERLVRNEEASGSNPLTSTKEIRTVDCRPYFFCMVIVRTAELSAVRVTSVRSARFLSSVRLTARGYSRHRRESAYLMQAHAVASFKIFFLLFTLICDIIT